MSFGSYVTFTNSAADNIYDYLGMGDAIISYGHPPGGDFCPAGTAGASYISPGYV